MADQKPKFSEPLKEFRLRENRQHSHGGIDLKPGDVVYLNAAQAVAFRDKFEAVDENADFKMLGQEVHEKFFTMAANRSAKAAGLGPIQPGDEAAQAQKDRTSTQVKAADRAGTAVTTFEHSTGTLTNDPGPTKK